MSSRSPGASATLHISWVTLIGGVSQSGASEKTIRLRRGSASPSTAKAGSSRTYKDGASVRLLSRTGRDHAKRFPEVAAALAADGIAARLAGQAVRKFVYVPGQLVVG